MPSGCPVSMVQLSQLGHPAYTAEYLPGFDCPFVCSSCVSAGLCMWLHVYMQFHV